MIPYFSSALCTYTLHLGGARVVTVIVIENELGEKNSSPGRGISHNANTLGKVLNPTILSLTMGRANRVLGVATNLGEGKF